MKKKHLIFSLLILNLLGIYLLASVNADNTSPTAGSPENPWITSGNGEMFNITAGNRTHIRTMTGNQIQVRTNECARIQINESDTNPTGLLPNQTRSVNRYMHIELNGTVAMNATLCRNYTNQELNGLGNVSTFRWAYYNTSKFQWEYAHQNWVEKKTDGAAVLCSTSHFSIWTILAPENDMSSERNPTPGIPFECKNGTGFALQAGNRYQIQTQSGFSLQLILNQGSEITVTEYEKSPREMKQSKFQIRTQTIAIEMNNSAQVQANFSYTFTNQIKNQLGIKNMEKLKFMFYNESSEKWESPKHQWLEENTLYCNTTHFSLWTIAEEETITNGTPGLTILPAILTLGLVLLKRSKKRN
ncbi:MAG: hypothetical protein ACFFB2_07885 [Promethearchaeota archaeon]